MIAQASETPSNVLVPRPISSRMTRLCGVALLRMLAVSVISTMNVLWPRLSSSVAPTRAKRRSTTPIRARFARDEAADLGQDRDQGDLADVGALARHVRAGDQQDRAVVGAESSVVGDEVAVRHQGVEHRMAAGLDLEDRLGDDLRPAVALPRGQLGERRRGRRPGPARAPAWISRGASAATRSRRVVNSSYSSSQARSSASQDLVLELLELGRDVALGVLDRLLADVVGRDLAALRLGVGDLDVVAEDLVEADLQAGDPRAADLLGLEPGDPGLAVLRADSRSSSSSGW